MTFNSAYNVAVALLQTASGWSCDDLLANPAKVVSAMEVLEEQGGEQGLELVEAVYELFPGFRNYDAKGNWTGHVAHENGWTA